MSGLCLFVTIFDPSLGLTNDSILPACTRSSRPIENIGWPNQDALQSMKFSSKFCLQKDDIYPVILGQAYLPIVGYLSVHFGLEGIKQMRRVQWWICNHIERGA